MTQAKGTSIPFASFRVGHKVPVDVFDGSDHSVLLLSKGTVITPKVIRGIRERNLTEAFLRPEDLEQIRPTPTQGHRGASVDYENDVSRSLDKIDFDDPVPQGEALIDRFQPRRPIAYDRQMVNQLIESRNQDVEELSSQLTELVEGSNEMPGRDIERITTNYIWNMAQDLDATLSVCQMPDKEHYWANHSLQMSVMGMALAAEMKLPEDEVRVAGISGLIHDLGMHKVPAAIKGARRRLSQIEFLEVMRHPIVSLDMMERVLGIPNRSRLIVYQIHERNDGSGYPRKRTGNKTYNLAKVLGVVDVYLALITPRPYRKALLPYNAMEFLLKQAQAGLWDPAVMRAFISLIGLFPVGSHVVLNNDCLAKVIRAGGEDFGKPQVTITHNEDGTPQSSDTVIDLAAEPDDGLRIVSAIPPVYEDE